MAKRRRGRFAAAVLGALALAGCASSVPDRQDDLCAVFSQYPEWYDYARGSEALWEPRSRS